MKKITQFTVILASAIIFTGCTQAVTETVKDTSLDEPPKQTNESISTETNTQQSTSEKSALQTKSSITKEFTVEVSQWQYSPDVIEVNEGDTVIIHAMSKDVPHSLTLPEFVDKSRENETGGINVLLIPNEEETITFIADKKGEFRFGCDVVCGAGHTTMHGTLKVL